MDEVERIRGHVSQELALEAERKQELLEGCGIMEEDLSKVRAVCAGCDMRS